MFENIISELVDKYIGKTVSKENILNDLFVNSFLKEKYVNEIRISTNIGIIANEVFKRLSLQGECKIMAIGDIKYFGEIKKQWEKLIKNSLTNIDLERLSGYDLNGQGSEKLGNTLFDYMNLYYDFPDLKKLVVNEIIPCYGATDGLVMILDTLKQKYIDKKINFIYPEASFMASISIAKSYHFNMISIEKPEKNNFFITKKQIDNLIGSENVRKSQKQEVQGKKIVSNGTYDVVSDREINFSDEEILSFSDFPVNIYYFTALGNPTGEKIQNNDLYEMMQYITTKDKNPIFVLDNVYVGLLKKEVSKKMFQDIFLDKKVLEKIVFCESLSKTLGTTGIRLASIWTINKELSLLFKKNIILKKAGYSKILDELVCNLLSDLTEVTYFQNKVFDYISEERQKFLGYMNDNFSKFFDFSSSSQVQDREGIYILLKLNREYNAQYIFAETQIIGVAMTLSDGDYIRYSFGNVN